MMTDILEHTATTQVIAGRRLQAAGEHPEWMEDWDEIMAPVFTTLYTLNRNTILTGLYMTTALVPVEDDDDETKAHWLLDHIEWIRRNFIPDPA